MALKVLVNTFYKVQAKLGPYYGVLWSAGEGAPPLGLVPPRVFGSAPALFPPRVFLGTRTRT